MENIYALIMNAVFPKGQFLNRSRLGDGLKSPHIHNKLTIL